MSFSLPIHELSLLSDKQDVERRKESRLEANQPVMVTALGLIGMPPMFGRVLDMSGSGLRVWTPHPVPCGARVKIEAEHLEMLGEVVRCEENGDGYAVGLMVLHVATVADKITAS